VSGYQYHSTVLDVLCWFSQSELAVSTAISLEEKTSCQPRLLSIVNLMLSKAIGKTLMIQCWNERSRSWYFKFSCIIEVRAVVSCGHNCINH